MSTNQVCRHAWHRRLSSLLFSCVPGFPACMSIPSPSGIRHLQVLWIGYTHPRKVPGVSKSLNHWALVTCEIIRSVNNRCFAGPPPDWFTQWVSYQIRKIAGSACPGNAGIVFPVTTGQRSRHAARHVRDACAMMHAGIATSSFLWTRWRGKHSRRMRNPKLYVSGKRPMAWHISNAGLPIGRNLETNLNEILIKCNIFFLSRKLPKTSSAKSLFVHHNVYKSELDTKSR